MLTLFRRFATVGIAAGLFAGLIVTLLQAFTTVPLIVAAEVYEQAAGHEHEASLAPGFVLASAGPGLVLVHGGEHHDDGEPGAISWQRRISTLGANLVAGAGFGLLLAGAMALAGHAYTPRTAAFWGLAGFATFAFAPSLGLPPELPGAVTADLAARQAWWLMTALATAAGLWLVLLSGRTILAALGLVLLAVPHLIGSPSAGLHGGVVPPELAAEFVTASLLSQAVFWVVLGYAVGWLGARLDARAQLDEALQPV
ncbi:MAG TPA: CbtA family protein [Geminicoccus sp.]|jgi:cobalt transporter subunit CbtA|uniref:CbtA family protein n=1 Tax=Geminicoccus sp. TaxID=2024832 RepID=UPI002E33F361|nr:CbtA family protein [Geminicoccus sp.]HEX2529094.1 CbtA family protein [Geminicoccus sp.]